MFQFPAKSHIHIDLKTTYLLGPDRKSFLCSVLRYHPNQVCIAMSTLTWTPRTLFYQIPIGTLFIRYLTNLVK